MNPLREMAQEKKDFKIHCLPVLKDNIIWIWEESGEAVVVDPALSEPVIHFLIENNLNLNSVLQTHHHDDHIGGTKGLLKKWPWASVIANKSDLDRIPFQSISLRDQASFCVMNHIVKAIEVPGHTRNHLVYYLEGFSEGKQYPILFSGDTLFGAGCGRLFEGSPTQMFESLMKLNCLPKNTKIYCAHEYTESNLRWALSLHPQDLLIKHRLNSVLKKKSQGISSLPSTIEEERKTNLFLRAKTVEEFSKLRKAKDSWSY